MQEKSNIAHEIPFGQRHRPTLFILISMVEYQFMTLSLDSSYSRAQESVNTPKSIIAHDRQDRCSFICTTNRNRTKNVQVKELPPFEHQVQ